jgi:hypothetical protein
VDPVALEVLVVQAELLALEVLVVQAELLALADQVALEAAAALVVAAAVAVAAGFTVAKAVGQLSAVVAAAVLVLQGGKGEVQGIIQAVLGPPEALVTAALAALAAVDTAE